MAIRFLFDAEYRQMLLIIEFNFNFNLGFDFFLNRENY